MLRSDRAKRTREVVTEADAGVVGYVCDVEERTMTAAQVSEENPRSRAMVGSTGCLRFVIRDGLDRVDMN